MQINDNRHIIVLKLIEKMILIINPVNNKMVNRILLKIKEIHSNSGNKIFVKKILDFIKRNKMQIIIPIGMYGIGNNHQFFIITF